MRRFFVTGTDTDVGKTRVAAAVARALAEANHAVTIVKVVQTGTRREEPGDAERAGTLAGVPVAELARFAKPADPWSAALAQRESPLRAEDLARALDAISGAVIAEGAGGLLVPLNREQHLGTFAKLAGLETIIAVGLRLGCINHALLTLEACRDLGLAVAGIVLVDRWQTSPRDFVEDVSRPLQGKANIFGIVPFETDELASVRRAASFFVTLGT
ncbi:MAG: dethiobiotin synthase [Candidatus Eremiobacteraeota bacterium]|nr:dethiobiotin synthase [Candidatus Eremiobacteraeota bacterium]